MKLRRRISAGEVQRIGGEVGQPFHQIGRLGPAGAAIGVDRGGVGEQALHPDMDDGRRVDAGQHAGARQGRDERREVGQVGAEIGPRLHLQPEEAALGVEGEVGAGDVVATLGVGQEGFLPLGDPLDRPADLLGRPGHQDMLRVEKDLHPEAAADVLGDDANPVLRHLEDRSGELRADEVRALRGGMEHEAAVALLVVADGAARLHRVDDQPVVDQLDRDRLVGLGEGRVDALGIALRPIETDVARRLVPDQGWSASPAVAVSVVAGSG